MPDDTLTIQCPAKVNLALSVGAPDAQTGLHPICSWMVAVGACDELQLSRVKEKSSFDIRWNDASALPGVVDWDLDGDLAYRAHRLLQAHVGRDLPVEVRLYKGVPAGAGLGGGSSDAAGMLTGVNRLYSLGLSDVELIRLGLRLGSDVGFAVWTKLGKGPAIVSGTGDRIEPIPADYPVTNLVLVCPPVRCVTYEVYQAYDRVCERAVVDEGRVRSLLCDKPIDSGRLFNDLTEAAFSVEPGLGELRERLKDISGTPVHLSGSGSAMFIVAENTETAVELSGRIKADTGFPTAWAATCPGDDRKAGLID